MRAADTPSEVWVQVLQHIPLKQRMSSCALVQRSWALAAAAATTEVHCTDLSAAAAGALSEQLNSSSSWAQHITGLILSCCSSDQGSLLSLRCPKLQHLDLSCFSNVQLGTEVDSPSTGLLQAGHNSPSTGVLKTGHNSPSTGILKGCPFLQSLSLQSCTLSQDPSTALAPLAALTALTRLHLADVYAVSPVDRLEYQVSLCPVLALTWLQFLRLVDVGAEDVEALLLSTDAFTYPDDGDGLYEQQQELAKQLQRQGAALLPSLTSLYVSTQGVAFNSTHAPGLITLTNLRALELRKPCDLGYADNDITALTQLTRLVLYHERSSTDGEIVGDETVYSYPRGLVWVNDGWSKNRWSDLEDPGHHAEVCVIQPQELMQWLPKLSQLCYLDVSGLSLHDSDVHPDWSALHHCTSLEILRLQFVYVRRSAWLKVFGGARFLKLRQLRISGDDACERLCPPMPAQSLQDLVTACPNLEVLELYGDSMTACALLCEVPMPCFFLACKLQDLVTACPNLEALELYGDGMLEKVPMKPLTQLSMSLAHLRLESKHKKLAPALATLRNLRHLHVKGRVPDLPLLQLTVLTQLTYFYREEAYCGPGTIAEVEFCQQAGSASTPIWQQLLQHCRKSSKCVAVFEHTPAACRRLQDRWQRKCRSNSNICSSKSSSCSSSRRR